MSATRDDHWGDGVQRLALAGVRPKNWRAVSGIPFLTVDTFFLKHQPHRRLVGGQLNDLPLTTCWRSARCAQRWLFGRSLAA